MNANTPVEQLNKKESPMGISRGRLLIRAMIMLILPAAILFLSSGRLNWGMAWVYVGLFIILSLTSRIIMLRKNPDLFVERAQAFDKENAKAWDRVLVLLVAIIGPMTVLIVAGLDMRFGWSSEIPLGLQLVALVIMMLGYLLGYWATASNKFFSGVVRIQEERGHTVVTTGPYQYVRHPGYAGAMIFNLAVPFMLDSLWALVPAVLTLCVLVIRTALEDKTLQAELDGYQEYAQQVRYRLLPGIW